MAQHKLFIKHPKLIEWVKLLSITTLAQVLIQVVAFFSGIIIIRELSIEEYAIYSLMNTLLSTMLLLSDAGIGTTIMAKGGLVWKDKIKLGVVLNTGLDLRKKIAVVSLLISIPILCFLLYKNNVSLYSMPLLILVLIPSFFSGLSNSILQTAPKLAQEIWPLQKNQLIMNGLRLILIVAILIFFPYAWVAVLIAGIPQVLSNVQLRKISKPLVDWEQAPSKEIQVELVQKIKHFLPGIIYYCFSGQIIIWIVSITGNTTSLAQLSALGRFTMALTLFTVIFNTVLKPRFARMEENKDLMLKRYLSITAILTGISFVIIGFAYIFPSQCIWLLGKGYQNLEQAFILNMVNGCVALMSGLMFSIYTSRSWVIKPVYNISINLISILAGVYYFDLTQLIGLLEFNIFLSVVQLVMNFSFGLIKILKLKAAII